MYSNLLKVNKNLFFKFFKSQKPVVQKTPQKSDSSSATNTESQSYDFISRKIDNQSTYKFKGTQINIPQEPNIKGIGQILYWSRSAKNVIDLGRLTKVIVECKDPLPIQNIQFKQLILKIDQSVMLQGQQNIIWLYRFGDKIGINWPQFWVKLERRFSHIKEINQVLQIGKIISKESYRGSIQMMNTIQKLVQCEISVPLSPFTNLLAQMRQARIGSLQFLDWSTDHLIKRSGELSQSSIINALKFCKGIKNINKQALQKEILKVFKENQLLWKMTTEQVAQLLSQLLYQDWKEQSELILKYFTDKLDLQKSEDVKRLVRGGIKNYKLPKEQFQKARTVIKQQIQSLSLQELAAVQKYCYIHQIQRIIDIQQHIFRNWLTKQLSLNALYEVVFAYHLTRQASRPFYRLLDELMSQRAAEIGLQVQLCRKFVKILGSSNLCRAQLLQELSMFIQ